MKLKPFLAVLGAILFLLSTVSGQAKTEEEINNYLNQTIIPEFIVDNMPALDALASVKQLANLTRNDINIHIAARDKVSKSTISLSLKNVSAYDLLTMIASLCDVKFAVKNNEVLFFQPGNSSPQ